MTPCFFVPPSTPRPPPPHPLPIPSPTPVGLSASLAATAEGGALQEEGAGGKSKAGLLKSLAVRAMSEAEYVSTGTLSDHQQTASGGGKGKRRLCPCLDWDETLRSSRL